MDSNVRALTNMLLGEISNALGFSKTGFATRFLGGPFRKATDRLSAIGLTADHMIATDGFPAACGMDDEQLGQPCGRSR